MALDTDLSVRLAALESATKEWGAASKKRLQEQVAISKAILRGRTGSDRLVESNVQATSDLLAQEIANFLAT